MARHPTEQPPLHMTTREVAALLRVKERKVYDLAAAGEIPHRRITGKLLFPRAEVMDWAGIGASALADRPLVLAGSHDPLLEWAVRESGSGLAMILNGSGDGLRRFADRQAAVAGIHVHEQEGWNVETVEDWRLTGCVLLAWAARRRGLVLSGEAGRRVSKIADLRGARVAFRQPESAAAQLFEEFLRHSEMSPDDLVPAGGFAWTESEAAAAVAAGEADAAVGIEAMARQYKLPFLPLIEERFDLLVDRRAYFTEPVRVLLDFAAGVTIRQKAEAMGGYRLEDTGAVRWLSP
ncbi:MAG: helix-turn-helix transcriptional regulator [Defluviicoccus sp.]|nr:helix-turn-helix transcriptional regulator [Defluviicoccus sp.]MDE0386572.1 helix-turn-helix transcriptional regulator [Defluviicoccus sp.]